MTWGILIRGNKYTADTMPQATTKWAETPKKRLTGKNASDP